MLRAKPLRARLVGFTVIRGGLFPHIAITRLVTVATDHAPLLSLHPSSLADACGVRRTERTPGILPSSHDLYDDAVRRPTDRALTP